MTGFEGPSSESPDAQARPEDDDLAAAELRARLRRKMFGVRAPGATIGRYTIVERIGGGSMGDVYAATDSTLGRTVALKVLQPAADDDPARRRLVREAQTIARLNHPNVVQIFEVGEHEGRVYFAMERIDGPTFEGWLQAAPRTWAEVVEMIRQAARGLAAAHAVGVIHRDVKPANLVVGSDDRVRVVDFGLAHAVRSARSSLSGSWSASTTGGDVIGTPGYMSPEHVGPAVIDARSDQFSLAVCLYEALYGARPHRAPDLQSLLRAIAAGRRDPVPRGGGVPRWLGRIVERALQRDPQARFESLDAFEQALGTARSSVLPRVAFAAGLFAAGAGVISQASDPSPGVARPAVPEIAMPMPPSEDGALATARARLAAGDVAGALSEGASLARRAEAGRRDRDAAEARILLAGAQVRTADVEASERALRAADVALRRAGNPASLRARLLVHRGAFAWDRGRIEEARAAFGHACDIEPESGCVWAKASRGEGSTTDAPLGARVVCAEAAWLHGLPTVVPVPPEGAADLRLRLEVVQGLQALARQDIDAAELARVSAERIASSLRDLQRWSAWRVGALSARIALETGAPNVARTNLESATLRDAIGVHVTVLEALRLRASLAADPSGTTLHGLRAVVRATWQPAEHPDRLAAVEAGVAQLSGDAPAAVTLVRAVLDELELKVGAERARARMLSVLAEVYAADGRAAAAASARGEAERLHGADQPAPEPHDR